MLLPYSAVKQEQGSVRTAEQTFEKVDNHEIGDMMTLPKHVSNQSQ